MYDQARLRIENEEYLRQHPELQTFMSMFMSAGKRLCLRAHRRPGRDAVGLTIAGVPAVSTVLEEQPPDVLMFACDFFSNQEMEQRVLESIGGVGFTA